MSRRTRWIALALALAAALSFALALQTGGWWTVGDLVTIRPTGTTVCFGGAGDPGCRRAELDWLGGSDTWRRAGAATVAACLIASLAVVALAGALAARRRGALAAGVSLTAALTAAAAGGVFVATFPGTAAAGDAPASLGAGVVLWAGGVVAAIAAATVVLRARPPAG